MSTATQRDLFASPPGASITSTGDAWCSKCRAKLDPERVQYWTAREGPFCSLRCADGGRVATSLQREAVQFGTGPTTPEEQDALDRQTLCTWGNMVGGDVDKLSRDELRERARTATQRHRELVAARKAARAAKEPAR